jgi:signal transduction histidine kinase/ActR/RegA family two-component response regulator
MCIRRRLLPLVLLATFTTTHAIDARDPGIPFDRALLTTTEQAWLDSHPILYEAETREASMAPLTFRDSQGIYVGITADYVAILAQRLGLKVELVEYPTVDAEIEAVTSGHADFMGSIVATPERARLMNLSEPYLLGTNLVMARANDERIESAADLAGRRIAIERGIRRRQVLAETIPNLHFVEALDATAAVELVLSGQADAYVGPSVVVRYHVNKLGRQQLAIRGPVYLPPRNYVFGVRPDALQLVSIFNRVLASINESERHAIESRWSPELPETLQWRAIVAATWPYLAVVGGIVAVVLAWNQSLRAQIRHRRVAEHHARVAQELAETANRTKSEFVASVSHEIRNPMNAILGMAHLLTESASTVKQRDQALKLQRSAKLLLRILNDLLDLSKIEAGKLAIESVPFDMAEVLEHCASLLGLQATEKGLKLVFDIPPAAPTALIGDPLRLGQILINLGTNAIKFTAAGTVTLRIEELSRDVGSVTLRFSVTDTGIGITEKELERIFEPFSQADSSISRRFGGTGLGLAISRHLVGRMGGRLEVRSVPGSGSEFHFDSRWLLQTQASHTLAAPQIQETPGLAIAEAAASAALPATVTPLSGRHLLVVDDNDINRDLAFELLSALGARVTVAEHGAEALLALDREPFDAVLMDCHMPFMDGYEAARAIRAQSQWKDLPIIAMTASDMVGDREDAIAAGMNDQIIKPVAVEALLDILLRWCTPKAARNNA